MYIYILNIKAHLLREFLYYNFINLVLLID